MKYRFTVTLDVDEWSEKVGREAAQAYVADAVATMMGCHHPTSPILQAKRVIVRAPGLRPVEQEIGYTFYDPEFDG